LADNDDSKKEDKHDLTRIEDLSEFLHSEDDDDFSDLDDKLDPNSTDSPLPDLPQENDEEFSDQATDPNIEFPEEFGTGDLDQEEEEIDFTAMEDKESDQSSVTEFGSDEFTTDEPSEFETNDFESNEFESNEFESNEFESNEFESNDFESTDLESTDSGPNEFETNEFETNEFETNEFKTNEFTTNESATEPDPFESQEEIVEDTFEEVIAEEPKIEEPVTKEPVLDELPPITDTPIMPADKTEIHREEKQESFKAPENFKELQNFAKNITYGNLAQEGNPPFSIVIKDIKFQEDLDDVLTLLKEFKIINEESEEQARQSLERGNMLIPRLGEYAAITLCHKLRRFDLNILMGLTEEIHPAKSYESNDQGLVTKSSVYGNQAHHYQFESKEVSLHDFLTATTPYLEGYDIIEYLKVVTENIVIDMEQFIGDHSLEEQLISELPSELKNIQVEKSISKENIHATNSDIVKDFFPANTDMSNKTKKLSLSDIYASLIEKLKTQGLDNNGNAIIGINFQVTPILASDNLLVNSKYQVTCSGNIVWANRR